MKDIVMFCLLLAVCGFFMGGVSCLPAKALIDSHKNIDGPVIGTSDLAPSVRKIDAPSLPHLAPSLAVQSKLDAPSLPHLAPSLAVQSKIDAPSLIGRPGVESHLAPSATGTQQQQQHKPPQTNSQSHPPSSQTSSTSNQLPNAFNEWLDFAKKQFENYECDGADLSNIMKKYSDNIKTDVSNSCQIKQ